MSTRYVIYGAGAIGGVVGARLHQAGHEVALIARGAHRDAIRRDGLRLVSPVEDVTLAIPVSDDPAELDVGRSDDIVLLCVKSQDTVDALQTLRAAGAERVPIICLQNGVANERAALRRYADVYGAVVLAPTSHTEPGVVEVQGATLSGLIDVGRFPAGTDARAEQVAAALDGARFRSRAVDDVMRLKHAKLLLNLGNAVHALFAESDARDELGRRVRDEGEAVLIAAGVPHDDPDVGDRAGRGEKLGIAPIPGRPRGGSSTWQSLARGTGAIETDYLNGEISLLGHLHDVPTPLNDALCRIAFAHARGGGAPNELSAEDVLGVGGA